MRRLAMVLMCLVVCTCLPVDGAFAASGGEIEDMLPAMDAILRAMMPAGAAYAPSDPAFFWESIRQMALNADYGEGGADIWRDDGAHELIVSTMAVREMAIALFFEYDGLLPIPDSPAPPARYDDDLSAYRFPLLDADDSCARIDGYALSLGRVSKGEEVQDSRIFRQIKESERSVLEVR